jgi:hypothetical protein
MPFFAWNGTAEPITTVNHSLTTRGMIGRMVWWESAATPDREGLAGQQSFRRGGLPGGGLGTT